jgi:glycerol-3-phosphate dehydrogenase (NAD(P)+)
MPLRCAVIGDGTMGIAMADLICRSGNAAVLWTGEASVREAIRRTHRHPFLFSDVELSPQLEVTDRPEEAVEGAALCLVCIPSSLLRKTVRRFAAAAPHDAGWLSATKGIETDSLKTMSVVLGEELGTARTGAVSGVNVAREILIRQPTTLVAASTDPSVLQAARRVLVTDRINLITTTDVRGVEFFGAFKNIVALTVGLATGMGLGENFRAVMVARGLRELERLAGKLGHRTELCYGLLGLSDVFLTCASPSARNHQVGVDIGRGQSVAEVLRQLAAGREVAEGIQTLEAYGKLPERDSVSLPLFDAAYDVVFGSRDLRRCSESFQRTLYGDGSL